MILYEMGYLISQNFVLKNLLNKNFKNPLHLIENLVLINDKTSDIILKDLIKKYLSIINENS